MPNKSVVDARIEEGKKAIQIKLTTSYLSDKIKCKLRCYKNKVSSEKTKMFIKFEFFLIFPKRLLYHTEYNMYLLFLHLLMVRNSWSFCLLSVELLFITGVNRRMPDNTMAKRKRAKGQPMVHKTLHRKLKIK